MNEYRIEMWNTRQKYADSMVVFAANTTCAREEAVDRLYNEWDYPEDWYLGDPVAV